MSSNSMDRSGPVVRKAFLLEAFANLLSLPLVTNTRLVLSYLLRNPAHINASTILFARLFGGLVIGGLTTALLYGAGSIKSRRVTYWTLGMGEVLLIPILLLEGLKENKDAALNSYVAFASIGLLAPPLLWRIYVLGLRPDLVGDERLDLKKDERRPLIIPESE